MTGMDCWESRMTGDRFDGGVMKFEGESTGEGGVDLERGLARGERAEAERPCR